MTTTSPYKTDRDEFIADIIVTAVEGGTGYWACVSEYRHECPNADVYAVLHENDEDGEIENDRYSAKALRLDRQSVAHALHRIESHESIQYLDGNVRDHLRDASRKNDATNIDAGDADIIAQLAVLGEIVYG